MVPLLYQSEARDYRGRHKLIEKVIPPVVFARVDGEAVQKPRRHAPFSDHLCETLRPWLQAFVPAEWQYELCFDKFEYLLSLVLLDLTGTPFFGCFGWRNVRCGLEDHPSKTFLAEAEGQGADWPPLKLGAFKGSLQYFKSLVQGLNEEIAQLGWL